MQSQNLGKVKKTEQRKKKRDLAQISPFDRMKMAEIDTGQKDLFNEGH